MLVDSHSCSSGCISPFRRIRQASVGLFAVGVIPLSLREACTMPSLGCWDCVLKISQMIIAVNKMDAIAWSDARYTEIMQQFQSPNSKRVQLSSPLRFIPLSAEQKQNIDKVGFIVASAFIPNTRILLPPATVSRPLQLVFRPNASRRIR